MDQPTDLIVQDVRCFDGEQQGCLRPITLLVGENSTGKTTFLGCYSALHRMLSEESAINDLPDFNEEPFVMGSFRDIVRARRGPSGRINEFKIGFALDAKRSSLPYDRLTVTLREQGSQPVVSCLRFRFSDESYLELQRTDGEGTIFRAPPCTLQETRVPFSDAPALLSILINERLKLRPNLLSLAFAGTTRTFFAGTARTFGSLRPIVEHLSSLDAVKRRSNAGGFDLPRLPTLIPVAPLRSKPKRTYDPVREIASPEGEHIPMLMMRLNRTDKDGWNALHDGLVEFGRDAGLFSDIKVKHHGKQMSDPFQLQVKVRSGPHANIVDVGYGISQSLPFLVDVMAMDQSLRRRRQRAAGRTFLLQQPEVHLHPRGQAQLASLFVEAYKRHGNRFLIETHSDYVIDRVRILVRQGALKADDVSILYFEPSANSVDIHNVSVDDDGNLQDAPPGYREFFLKETDRLLGFAD